MNISLYKKKLIRTIKYNFSDEKINKKKLRNE
jgi:hypothetical protein